MSRRANFLELKRLCVIDLSDIQREVFRFYNSMNVTSTDLITAPKIIFQARRFLNNARALIKNYIGPEHNTYIKDLETEHQSYSLLLSNWNNLESNLDTVEKKVTNEIESRYNQNVRNFLCTNYEVYRRDLQNIMENFVEFPLRRAIKRFQTFKGNVNGKTIIKDEELFLYFLFLELFRASELFGISGKTTDAKTLEMVRKMAARSIPQNVRTHEPIEEEEEQDENGTMSVEEFYLNENNDSKDYEEVLNA